MKLRINELYGPILQGEGNSLGTPVLFVRVAGCNLHCSWCDTSYTWNYSGTPYTHDYAGKVKKEDEIKEMEIEEVVSWIQSKLLAHKVHRVVISGGEPLVQQKGLLQLVKAIPCEFEIETNGTFVPTPELDACVVQYNVSPKLKNSGNPDYIRERHLSLEFFAQSPKAYFKYVVSKPEDLVEVKEQVSRYSIPSDRVFLMPLGHDKKTQEENLKEVEKLCLQTGYRLSPRLHVLIHGNKRAI